jgi:hypothetical protein
MNSTKGIKIETISKEEGEKVQEIHKTRLYDNALLERTQNAYEHSGVKKRRERLAGKEHLILPLIPDSALEEIYNLIRLEYYESLKKEYEDKSGFQITPYERTVINNIKSILASDEKFNQTKLYPTDLSVESSKAIIGSYVPDAFITGLSIKGSSSIIIEIDGLVHEYKPQKDMDYEEKMKEMGIFLIRITNEMAGDREYLKKVLYSCHRGNSAALQKQTLRNWRRIWCYTIAYFWALPKLEEYVRVHYGLSLNLINELKNVIKISDYPRKMKRDAKKILTLLDKKAA